MPNGQRAFVLACCSVIAAALAYVASDWGAWPRLMIFPVTGDVAMAVPSRALAIHYLGLVAWGLGGAACGIAIGAALCLPSTFGRGPWSDRTLGLFGAWAITAVLLAGGYYTWNLWPW